MIRLGVLLLITLAGLYLVLATLGDGDLRTARRQSPAPEPVVQDNASQTMTAIVPDAAPIPVVAAESQTPERVQAFPGPALRPSPEYRDSNPAAAPLDGPVMYVTGDRVNMRAGPSTSDRVIAGLTRGTAVQILGSPDTEWVNIRSEGRDGYIAGRFLAAAAP